MSGQIHARALLDEHVDAVAVPTLDGQSQGRRSSVLGKKSGRRPNGFLGQSLNDRTTIFNGSVSPLRIWWRWIGSGQTKGFCPLLDVFFPSIYWIFRATQNANRWRIINQMFVKSLPLDARVKIISLGGAFRLVWQEPSRSQ